MFRKGIATQISQSAIRTDLCRRFVSFNSIKSGTAERFFISGANRAPKVRDI